MLSVSRNAEAKLVELLGDIEEQRDSWTIIFFHLQKLIEQFRNDYHLRIAVNLTRDLMQDLEGYVFTFSDGSMAVACRHLNSVLMNKLVFQMRYLYMDDPLAYTEEGNENPDFCTIFKLFTDYQSCVDFATRRMTKLARMEDQKPKKAAVGNELPPLVKPRPVFKASSLASIEEGIEERNLNSAVRRQPICAVKGKRGEVKHVFDELYMHMSHLRDLLAVDFDFFSNKWLFKYMTLLLDQRVIEMIGKNPSKHLSHPLSININAETLVTDWFQRFDDALEDRYKVSVVFEIPVVDVFADMALFNLARDTVQKHGYRVCIDGLSSDSIIHIDRAALKADLLKLQWNADVVSDLDSAENQKLARAIEKSGPTRIILCRCDNEQAVEYGQALGISLFQGRYLDTLINPNATVSN